jgi:hypothetical protein
MNINLGPFLYLWALLAVLVLAMIAWRQALARKEDDTLHVSVAENAPVSQQVTLAAKLEKIDKWGKMLTIIALGYGLLLGAVYLYQFWMSSAVTRG